MLCRTCRTLQSAFRRRPRFSAAHVRDARRRHVVRRMPTTFSRILSVGHARGVCRWTRPNRARYDCRCHAPRCLCVANLDRTIGATLRAMSACPRLISFASCSLPVSRRTKEAISDVFDSVCFVCHRQSMNSASVTSLNDRVVLLHHRCLISFFFRVYLSCVSLCVLRVSHISATECM